MAKTIELEDRDFAFVIKMQKQVNGLGQVTGYAPTIYVYVGEKQIGLVSSVRIAADASSTPDIEVRLADGLTYEYAKNLPDEVKGKLAEYEQLLNLVPGVKSSVPHLGPRKPKDPGLPKLPKDDKDPKGPKPKFDSPEELPVATPQATLVLTGPTGPQPTGVGGVTGPVGPPGVTGATGPGGGPPSGPKPPKDK